MSYDRPLHAWTARRRCVVHQPAMQRQMLATGRLRGLLRSALRSGKFLVMLVIFGKGWPERIILHQDRSLSAMICYGLFVCVFSMCPRSRAFSSHRYLGLGAGCVILGFKVYAHTAKNVPNSSLQHVAALSGLSRSIAQTCRFRRVWRHGWRACSSCW